LETVERQGHLRPDNGPGRWRVWPPIAEKKGKKGQSRSTRLIQRRIAVATGFTGAGARAEGGETPLHAAAAFGTPETVAALIRVGADLEARDKDGLIPADLAEKNPALRNHAIFWTLNEARFD